jgi:NADPH:quinone reductase-like Zn-dependent oxidoreductase
MSKSDSKMQFVEVVDWESGPKLATTDAPAKPSSPSMTQVHVVAVGQHHIVRSMASGKHYASGALPHIPGVDGVGIDTSTNKMVYFFLLGMAGPRKGSFAEYVNVPKSHVCELPGDVDPVQVASLMNAVMSSWMAFKGRVDFLRDTKSAEEAREWTCLILGATTMSGRLATKTARTLGATQVFGAARNESKLAKQDLDARIVLREPASATDFSPASTVSVVLDYLYGPHPRAFLESTAARAHTASSPPLTFVSIGALAGAETQIPSALLRSRDVTLRGAGIGSWDVGELGGQVPAMMDVLRGVKMDEVKAVSVRQVEEAWSHREGERVVFVFDEKYATV